MIASRLQAFAVHLSGSVVVALASAALVFLVWYPGTLSSAAGVTAIFLILLGVDVVIGPVITLIVFDRAKKELRRDLAIVLVLQLAALTYGLHAVAVARPVYVVYNAGRFDLVYANDLTGDKLAKVSDARFKQPPWLGPELIAARPPADATARRDMTLNAIAGGDDLPQLPQYYVPYLDEKDQIQARLQPLENLRKTNPRQLAQVEALEARYDGKAGFLPVRGKVQDLVAVVSRDTAQMLDMVELEPW